MSLGSFYIFANCLDKYKYREENMKILHLEDSVSKYSEIRSVLNSCGIKSEDIVWVTNLADGIYEINEAEKRGEQFDLAITDMYYPVEPGGYEEKDTGDKFVKFVKKERLSFPVIICSSVKIRDGSVHSCIWFSPFSNWEIELRGVIEELKQSGRK